MLSVSVRFVENVGVLCVSTKLTLFHKTLCTFQCKVHEYFLEFIQLTGLTGEVISDGILNFLKEAGLDLLYLRGQGYDGAAAMSGAKIVCA